MIQLWVTNKQISKSFNNLHDNKPRGRWLLIFFQLFNHIWAFLSAVLLTFHPWLQDGYLKSRNHISGNKQEEVGTRWPFSLEKKINTFHGPPRKFVLCFIGQNCHIGNSNCQEHWESISFFQSFLVELN